MRGFPRPSFRLLFFGLLVFCTLAAVFTGSLDPGSLLNVEKAWNRVLWPLVRLSFFISLGLFGALVIEGAGWTRRLTILARPFMRWGHLSHEIGSAFTASFLSGTASLAMLATFHREGAMRRRDVVLAVLLDTFPSYFLHLPTTFFVILPLIGKAGFVYLLVTLCAALLRFAAVLVYSRFSLPAGEALPVRPLEKQAWRGLLRQAAQKLSARLTRILLIVAPVYLLVLLLSDGGFFEWLRKALALGVGSRLLPVEGISVVILSLMAEVTSGYAAAGAMLEAGTLTVAQTVLALVLGQIIGSPLRALRHQLPYYMGIFSPGMGIFLMVTSQLFRVVSLAAAAAVFLLFV
jgi:hypothetical protein